MSALQAVSGVASRHSFLVRSLLAEVALFALAWLIITLWQSEMANVVFGIVVIFAGAFAVVTALAGGSIAIGRLLGG